MSGQLNPSNSRCTAEAIENAQMLLAFAFQRGTPVEPSIAKAIIDAGSSFSTGYITPRQQADFWAALDALAKTLVIFPPFLGQCA
jgi:hypothetical protein